MNRFITLTDLTDGNGTRMRINVAHIVAYYYLDNTERTYVIAVGGGGILNLTVGETPEEIDKLIQAAVHRATAFDPSDIK